MYSLEKERLAEIAKKTETLYINKQNNLISDSTLQNYIDAMSYVSKSKLYILNINENNIDGLKNLELENEDLDAYLYQDLKDILKGNEVFRNSQYTKAFNTRMIFYGRPIVMDNEIKGSIIIFSPINYVNKNIQLMFTVISGISLISILVVGIVIFISSKRMAQPIYKVRDSALKIANGTMAENIDQTNYTELNELVEAFNYMKTELNRIESDKKAFISMISHEIKTPLTVISGYLEAIHDNVLDAGEAKDSLEIVYRETLRLTDLTKEIVTKTSNKDLELYLEPTIFRLKPLLEEIVRLSGVNPKKTIQFTLDCDENITMYADENKIRQVMNNLVSNAIKYSNESVKIDITCFAQDDQLCLQVGDNGLGIKKSELNKIFDQYYRVRNTSHLLEGNGLGLNIVRKLIELHKGRIDITSEFKKGTTVTLRFPL